MSSSPSAKLSKGIGIGGRSSNTENDNFMKDNENLGEIDHSEGDRISRAQILEWMLHGGAPPAIAENVANIYAQHQPRCSPPPLPQRPDDLATPRPSPPPPAIKATSDYEILIVDEFRGDDSRRAQYQFELLRLWSANNGGSWLFHRVDSTGLAVERCWRVNSAGEVVDGSSRPNSMIVDVRDVDMTTSVGGEHMTESPLFPKPTDRPFEDGQIIDRIHRYHGRPYDVKDFSQYDCLIAWDRQTFHDLCVLLSERARHPDLSSEKTHSRVFLLEIPKVQYSMSINEFSNTIYWAVSEFARKEFG